jgi:hypothetical protein
MENDLHREARLLRQSITDESVFGVKSFKRASGDRLTAAFNAPSGGDTGREEVK